jgi:hypothetical protein
MRRNSLDASGCLPRISTADTGDKRFERHEVRDARQRPPAPEHDLGIGSDEIRPLPGNRADFVVGDREQEPHSVPVRSLGHTSELLSGVWMEWVGDAH